MKSGMCEFDGEKLLAAVNEDGRSQIKIAKAAGVDKKTLARAIKELPVRQYAAQRIAGELRVDLSKLLKPSNVRALPNQTTARINLCDKNLTGKYRTRDSWTEYGREKATCITEAYPQNAESLVSNINSAGATSFFGGAETPKVTWEFLKQTPWNPDVEAAMLQLESSLAGRTENTTASSLTELIGNLRTEESVAEALSVLRACGVHILAVTATVELAPGMDMDDRLNWHIYKVPIAIVAPVSINMAVVEYSSVIKKPKVTDSWEDDDEPPF